MRYRLYQYVIAINHFNDEMTIFENKIKGLESDFSTLETFINQKNAPVFPFETKDEEKSNLTDEEMAELVEMAKKTCDERRYFPNGTQPQIRATIFQEMNSMSTERCEISTHPLTYFISITEVTKSLVPARKVS